MKYSKDHVWVRKESEHYRIGLTTYAQDELGEIAFIELPATGTHVAEGEAICSIDSLKSSSDLYAPFAGTVVEVNETLEGEGQARIINTDPTGAGWILGLKPDTEDSEQALMDEDAYRSYTGG